MYKDFFWFVWSLTKRKSLKCILYCAHTCNMSLFLIITNIRFLSHFLTYEGLWIFSFHCRQRYLYWWKYFIHQLSISLFKKYIYRQNVYYIAHTHVICHFLDYNKYHIRVSFFNIWRLMEFFFWLSSKIFMLMKIFHSSTFDFIIKKIIYR